MQQESRQPGQDPKLPEKVGEEGRERRSQARRKARRKRGEGGGTVTPRRGQEGGCSSTGPHQPKKATKPRILRWAQGAGIIGFTVVPVVAVIVVAVAGVAVEVAIVTKKAAVVAVCSSTSS